MLYISFTYRRLCNRLFLLLFVLVAQQCCSWQRLVLQLHSLLMVKQHAHAILANDRLGLLHWSGAFQSQRCTKSVSSTSQSSRGAVRTLSTCTRMHACINKHWDMFRGICATEKQSADTDICSDWWMWIETHTKPLIFVYSIYLPTVPQRSLFLTPFSRSINSRWEISFCSSSIVSSLYMYVISHCEGINLLCLALNH